MAPPATATGSPPPRPGPRTASPAGHATAGWRTGTAGIGKTTLAVRWARRAAGGFPDGQLFANLHGFDAAGAAIDPGDVLRRFLEALGLAAARIPADLAGRAALYRSVLATRRVLIVLDNARNAGQVRPLLPGASGCAAVITSRSQLTGLVADWARHEQHRCSGQHGRRSRAPPHPRPAPAHACRRHGRLPFG